jgi:endonuclease/exonuclease/phosphatase family metal-dependent hydrolase
MRVSLDHDTMEDGRFRVMTYNIHSCVDLLGRVAPDATVDAIRLMKPDVVALQEVDDRRPQTARLDQAQYLGERLDMSSYFCPTVLHREGRYGLAVLSRYQLEISRCDRLPILWPLRLQRRGAMHAVLHSPAGRFHFFNTHLSLLGPERLLQMGHLTRRRWLGAGPRKEPIIFCGDLNAVPGSPVYRRLAAGLKDVQTARGRSLQRARPTYSSRRPLLRLDHIFVSPWFRVIGTEVPSGPPFRTVSDHLPLCADLLAQPYGQDSLAVDRLSQMNRRGRPESNHPRGRKGEGNTASKSAE